MADPKLPSDLLAFLRRAGVVDRGEGVAVGTTSRGVDISLSYEQARRLADLPTGRP